jgi:hypothetical protein
MLFRSKWKTAADGTTALVRHARKCAIAQDALVSMTHRHPEGAFEIPELHSLFEVRTCTMKAAVAV